MPTEQSIESSELNLEGFRENNSPPLPSVTTGGSKKPKKGRGSDEEIYARIKAEREGSGAQPDKSPIQPVTPETMAPYVNLLDFIGQMYDEGLALSDVEKKMIQSALAPLYNKYLGTTENREIIDLFVIVGGVYGLKISNVRKKKSKAGGASGSNDSRSNGERKNDTGFKTA